jgi:uncharacterized membrane protein
MSIGALLLLGLVIARIAQARAADRSPVPPALTARVLLADRFARGEIDETEYRRRVDVPNESAGGPTSAR